MNNYKHYYLNYVLVVVLFLLQTSVGETSTAVEQKLSGSVSVAEAENFNQLEKDTEKFANYTDKLSRLCVAALSEESYLNATSDKTKFLSQREVRFAYRFWRLFYKYFNQIDTISEKYKAPIVFKHKKHVNKSFAGYTLGVAAKVIMANSVNNLMIYLKDRVKLQVLLNEGNKEFDYPSDSMNKVIKHGLRPTALAQIYKFRSSYYDEVAGNIHKAHAKNVPPFVRDFLIMNEEFMDKIILTVVKNHSWKFLSRSFVTNTMEKFDVIKRVMLGWAGAAYDAGTGNRFVKNKDIESFKKHLQPGDIIINRYESNIANVALRGFWIHTMLYIGSPEEAGSYFDKDPLVKNLCRKYSVDGFVELLKKKYPDAVQKWLETDKKNGNVPRRIIESMPAGVIITSAQQAFISDHLAAIRPRLRVIDKAKAIMRAFAYFGSEYDICFSFTTENSVVCTELVAKAYTANNKKHGLTFTLKKVYGIMAVPSNLIAEKYSTERNTDRAELDFVAFLRGSIKNKTVSYASEKDFADSYLWDDGMTSKNAK